MNRRRVVELIFLAGTVVGVFFATQAYYNPAIQPPLTWNEAIGVNLVYYYLWALATPLVITMARRFRFESGRWGVSVLVHAVVSTLVTSAGIVLGEGILTLLQLRSSGPFLQQVRFSFVVNFYSSIPTYWLILFVYLAFDYYVKFRDREVRGAQLAAQLSSAQLQALKMQLRPHFLFNTLNSISSLMYSDVEAADQMLARLSEFLRLTLDREVDQEIALEDEIEFLRRYLEIEKIRFEDRLSVRIEVERGTERARVPTMALQPLVENAIHHGIAPRPEGGTIAVRAQRENGMLLLSVSDDGVGGGNNQLQERVGLANTRARLDHLYGSNHRFHWHDSPEGGFLVEMAIPYRSVDPVVS